MKIDATWTVNDLLEEAMRTLEDVESGETFTVSDLFRGFEWKRLPAYLGIQWELWRNIWYRLYL